MSLFLLLLTCSYLGTGVWLGSMHQVLKSDIWCVLYELAVWSTLWPLLYFKHVQLKSRLKSRKEQLRSSHERYKSSLPPPPPPPNSLRDTNPNIRR